MNKYKFKATIKDKEFFLSVDLMKGITKAGEKTTYMTNEERSEISGTIVASNAHTVLARLKVICMECLHPDYIQYIDPDDFTM